MTVVSLAEELGLWRSIRVVISDRLAPHVADAFIDRLDRLPVKRSYAVQRLGSYIAKGGEPQAIRLQFAQESEQLRITFLHELAHACDHLTNQPGRPYRQAHGAGWRQWMIAFGLPAESRGKSEALSTLREQRLKVVAVCHCCGAEIKRLRRFDRRKRYLHIECGGKLVPV
jgi:predicted SprT family Zn-dependent metalloprotease